MGQLSFLSKGIEGNKCYCQDCRNKDRKMEVNCDGQNVEELSEIISRNTKIIQMFTKLELLTSWLASISH